MENLRRHKKRRIIYVFVAILCTVVIAWCVFATVSELLKYNRGIKLYDSLNDELVRAKTMDNEITEAYSFYLHQPFAKRKICTSRNTYTTGVPK